MAVIDDVGRVLVDRELPDTRSGFDRLAALLAEHDVSKVGIEGSGNYGRPAPTHLALTVLDLEVVEVPPRLTSRERKGRPLAGRCAKMRVRST